MATAGNGASSSPAPDAPASLDPPVAVVAFPPVSGCCMDSDKRDKPKTTHGFYRRPLPPTTCIPFDSPQGKLYFQEAMLSGTMECYFSLAANFTTQADPATCGLGTLSMVLNSLEMDPDRIWKGSWRWYSEDMLDCCSPMEEVLKNGVTLDEFVCKAECNGADVKLVRVQTAVDKEQEERDLDRLAAGFRATVKRTSSRADEKLVVAYNRSILLQTGTGHYSPIGGYHEASDHVLILDVARFKYPPHWVPLQLLVKSMSCIDPATGLSRGYVTISRSKRHISVVLKVEAGRSQWKQLADAYRETLEFRLKKNGPPASAMDYLVRSCGIILEVQAMDHLLQFVDSLKSLAEEHQHYIEKVFAQLASTPLMAFWKQFPEPCCPGYTQYGYKEVAIIFLLSQGLIGAELITDETVKGELLTLLDYQSCPDELRSEVLALRSTLQVLQNFCHCQMDCHTATKRCVQ